MLKELINKIKKYWKDPLKDPRCKNCVFVDGLLCLYPEECNCMQYIEPIALVVEHYAKAITRWEDYKWLLEHDVIVVTMQHPCYKDKFSNDIFHKYDGEWNEYGRNTIFSSSHLFPVFDTEEEAWSEGVKEVKEHIEWNV